MFGQWLQGAIQVNLTLNDAQGLSGHADTTLNEVLAKIDMACQYLAKFIGVRMEILATERIPLCINSLLLLVGHGWRGREVSARLCQYL